MKKRLQVQPTDLLWGTVVLLLIILQFWWLPGERGATSDSYSPSLDGKLGLYRTLSSLYPEVVRDPLRLTPQRSATLIVVAPDRYPTGREASELADFVRQGGTLLIAPNWSSEPCQLTPLQVDISPMDIFNSVSTSSSTSSIPTTPAATPDSSTSGSKDSSEMPAEAESPEAPLQSPNDAETSNAVEENGGLLDVPEGEAGIRPPTGPSSEIGSLDQDEMRNRSIVVSASSDLVGTAVDWRKSSSITRPPNARQLEVLVTSADGTPEVMSWRIGQGRIVACSSPDVFSNRSMLKTESRRLAVRLVEYCHQAADKSDPTQRPLVLCEFLTASNAYRHAGVLLSPALRMGSLQLVLLAVLTAWLGFYRFGPPRITHSEKRRNLSESAVAVGNLQYRLHDGGKLVCQYMEYINSELRRTHGGIVQLDHIDELCRRTGLSEDELSDQLRKAERLQSSTGVSSAAAAECIRWLAELRQRLSTPDRQRQPPARSKVPTNQTPA